jgi:hypothetical protein
MTAAALSQTILESSRLNYFRTGYWYQKGGDSKNV